MGQPEKNSDTFSPSRVADVMRTFKLEARNFTNRFIRPSKTSLIKKNSINRHTLNYIMLKCETGTLKIIDYDMENHIKIGLV